MTNEPSQTVNSTKLTEQVISLDEAYAQSAGQDKLIAADFDVALGDGLEEEHSFKNQWPQDFSHK